MLLLKSCPKCHGDIVEERDRYGRYAQCLQCGYTCEAQSRSLASSVRVINSIGEQSRNKQNRRQ